VSAVVCRSSRSHQSRPKKAHRTSPSKAGLRHHHLPRPGVIPDVGLPGKALAADFEGEPRTALRLIRPGRSGRTSHYLSPRPQLPWRGEATQPYADCLRGARQACPAASRSQNHYPRWFGGARYRRSNGCVARLSSALGDRIGGGEDLCGLLIKEQVIVSEVGSGDVPVEIFCLNVDRIAVRQMILRASATVIAALLPVRGPVGNPARMPRPFRQTSRTA